MVGVVCFWLLFGIDNVYLYIQLSLCVVLFYLSQTNMVLVGVRLSSMSFVFVLGIGIPLVKKKEPNGSILY